MDEHRIIKKTQPVTLELSDGSRVEGEVLLGLYEVRHTGRQEIGDLLNESLAFIPVNTAKGTLLVNTSQIEAGSITLKRERDELMTLGKKHAVHLKTTRGREMAGEVSVNLPEDACRVKDDFNQPLLFFPLFQPPSIGHINRDSILSVLD